MARVCGATIGVFVAHLLFVRKKCSFPVLACKANVDFAFIIIMTRIELDLPCHFRTHASRKKVAMANAELS